MESPTDLLRIGVSACFMHADPMRALFKGKTLLYAEESMLRWIAGADAGALPLLVPPPGGPLTARAIVRALDGLVLQGGADMSPRSYGEEPARPEWSGDAVRDAYEMELVRVCLEEDRPVLGVCRGLQVLNVTLGGSLYQDIATMHPDRRVHRDWERYDHLGHVVAAVPGSALARWTGSERLGVNSVHHQGVKALGAGLVVEAHAIPDGIVEAVRYAPAGAGAPAAAAPFAYAVQWHPEFMQDVAPDVASEATSPVPPTFEPRHILDPFLAEVRRRKLGRSLPP